MEKKLFTEKDINFLQNKINYCCVVVEELDPKSPTKTILRSVIYSLMAAVRQMVLSAQLGDSFVALNEEEEKNTISIEERRKNFEKNFDLVKDSTLCDFLRFYFSHFVQNKFFTLPASNSGKYHPKVSLGEGGLVRHTELCVKIAKDLIESGNCHVDHEDEVFVAILLHDIEKGDEYASIEQNFLHPVNAAESLFRVYSRYIHNNNYDLRNIDYKNIDVVMGRLESIRRISRMIASHMGKFNTNPHSKEILPIPESNDEKFVHMVDYIASRRWFE